MHERLKERQVWMAAIADRVRNPLAGIGAALNIIETRFQQVSGAAFDDDIASVSLAKIRERLKSLNDYVTELVEFANEPAIIPERTNLRELLMKVAEERRLALPSDGGIEIHAVEHLHVYADAQRLRTILDALISNSIEAVGSVVAPSILIKVWEEHPGTHTPSIIFEVEDNGPGFPEILIKRAIEPFFSTKEAGTGLGLAIARKYVEAHGGIMTLARSEQLGGAKVRIAIPNWQRGKT